MLLKNLLKNTGAKIFGTAEIEIGGIAYDSRKVSDGFLFVAIKGFAADGHDYINKAVELGASAVVSERHICLPVGITLVVVENSRKALALISAEFFGNPAKELTTIAITGTKGKTTATAMIRSILEQAKIKTGTIGTLGIGIGDSFTDTGNTTPESYELQKALRDMLNADCKAAVIEASSQGFKLDRTFGMTFDIGIFTNLSPDHIGDGEHADFAEYLQCKSMLFKQCKFGAANIDDKHFADIMQNADCPIITFGFSDNSDFIGSNEKLKSENGFIGVSFDVSGKRSFSLDISIPGKFNAYNALAAVAAADILGLSDITIKQGLKTATVKGRLEPVPVPADYSMLIDYAHNGVSMESVLTTLRQYNPQKLICLFGAGGNRPKERRLSMGEISGKLADLSVLTEDNSRNENVMDIIADIALGVEKSGGKYVVYPARKDAIRYCMKIAQRGDIIVLAGKGHETYHEINGVKHHMDERELVKEILDEAHCGTEK